jgi:CRP/FNR family cyclic AMP-dependent transcriptional regulator
MEGRMSVGETLQRSALFRDFTDTGLKIFAALAAEKSIPAGTPLFVETMVGESLFIVKSGTVRITQHIGSEEKELAVIGEGEHLGSMALLGKSTRLVSAIAATPCEVLEITQRDFFQLQSQKPQACLKLALAIAGEMTARINESREALRETVRRAGQRP